MTEEEWGQWKHDDITKKLFAHFERTRDTIIDRWASGAYTRESAEGTAQLNAEALARVNVLNEIINLEPEDIEGGIE